MDRFNWIMKEIYKDGKKNFRWVIKGAGLLLAMILLIKLLIFFGMRRFVLTFTGYIDSDRDAIQLVFDGL
jgi:hypothetical protein